MGAEMGFLGARGTGGFLSGTVCLGTGGLVMRERRGVPLVVAGVLDSGVGVWLILGRAEFKMGRKRESQREKRKRESERERYRQTQGN